MHRPSAKYFDVFFLGGGGEISKFCCFLFFYTYTVCVGDAGDDSEREERSHNAHDPEKDALGFLQCASALADVQVVWCGGRHDKE